MDYSELTKLLAVADVMITNINHSIALASYV
jgi:hypothetical protein